MKAPLKTSASACSVLPQSVPEKRTKYYWTDSSTSTTEYQICLIWVKQRHSTTKTRQEHKANNNSIYDSDWFKVYIAWESLLPCLILGRERKGGNGLGSDTFAFPTSRHILESTGSIPENKEAGCTTHEYPRPVSLESSTCVHSRKGTSFSHTPFQAAVHEAAINKEWKNKQVAGKEQQKSHQGKGKSSKIHIQTDVQMMYLSMESIQWQANLLSKTWTYWFS